MNSTTGNQEQVAIYSDEPILAAGFESVIATDPELELTGCCSTVAELKEHLSYTRPELAVVGVTPEIHIVHAPGFASGIKGPHQSQARLG
jgi:hypothetical protein